MKVLNVHGNRAPAVGPYIAPHGATALSGRAIVAIFIVVILILACFGVMVLLAGMEILQTKQELRTLRTLFHCRVPAATRPHSS